jgi:2,4-dienoyl-CoA reductase-like NADH-dependent reductase (Old Yellow Enzyme family)
VPAPERFVTTPFPRLFSPIMLGRIEAKNRVMRVATTCNLAVGSRISDRQLAFYQAIARGGVGSIVTENMRVTVVGAAPNVLVASDRDAIPGFQKLAQAVHAEGALLIGQINHGGRQHLTRRVPPLLVAPSALACPRSGGVPHGLSVDEIAHLVQDFVQSAVNCIEAGFDGVEIHCAQGHLMQQFLSPFSNRRDDAYGGSFDNRLRFVREVVDGIRRELGAETLLGMRLATQEFSDGGLEVRDSLAIARALSGTGGIDYVSLSQGNFNSIETHLPDRHSSISPYRESQAEFKRALPALTVVANTRIQTPAQAEDLLTSGEADMVGLCRAMIVDPQWAEKARSGRQDEIRRCIACNQCWAWLSDGEPIACSTNPEVGRELALGELKPATVRKHVVIVGGGPAGLEAARISAARGHRVTLLERSSVLGGKVQNIARIRHYEETRHLIDFLIPQVGKSGATIRLNHDATPRSIAAEQPDVLILAHGADVTAPPVPGDGSVPVLGCEGPLPENLPAGANVIVVDEDGYYWSAAVAENAADAGLQVTVVTRLFEPFREMPVVSRIATLKALDRHNAIVQPNCEIARVEAGHVVLRHYLSKREWRVDDVAAILWTGIQTPSSLNVDAIKGIAVHAIGDAVSPRRFFNALTEAHVLARTI